MLILCPASVTKHWEREFERVNTWLDESSDEMEKLQIRKIYPYVLAQGKSNDARLKLLREWKEHSGVLITTYDMYRNLVFLDEHFTQLLCTPGPDVLILDEGHKIRHLEARISKALRQIDTKKRIILTGYPLQNNLVEYWTMIDFVKPDFLDSLPEFKILYVKPISKGQNAEKDSDPRKAARRRAWLLHEKVKSLILRRGVSLLRQKLPEKYEMVIKVRLTSVQRKLYSNFVQLMNENNWHFVFWSFNITSMLGNHPDILYHYYQKKLKKKEKPDDEKLAVASPTTPKSAGVAPSDEEVEAEMKESQELEVLQQMFQLGNNSEYKTNVIENSNKMLVLYSIMFQCKAAKDKLVIFSKSIPSLDFIESSIKKYSIGKDSQKQIHYVRFDGSTKIEDRQTYIDRFNDEKGNVDVFLISTLAGGEGINLCGANRVVLLDTNWNPSHDCEACCRVYRFGQKKKVFIYRLISEGTMEGQVFEKQLRKEMLSRWVVDDQSAQAPGQITTKLLVIPEPPSAQDTDVEIDEKIHDEIITTLAKKYPKGMSSIQLQDCLLSEDPLDRLTEEEKRAAVQGAEYSSIYGRQRRPSSANRAKPQKRSPQPQEQPEDDNSNESLVVPVIQQQEPSPEEIVDSISLLSPPSPAVTNSSHDEVNMNAVMMEQIQDQVVDSIINQVAAQQQKQLKDIEKKQQQRDHEKKREQEKMERETQMLQKLHDTIHDSDDEELAAAVEAAKQPIVAASLSDGAAELEKHNQHVLLHKEKQNLNRNLANKAKTLAAERQKKKEKKLSVQVPPPNKQQQMHAVRIADTSTSRATNNNNSKQHYKHNKKDSRHEGSSRHSRHRSPSPRDRHHNSDRKRPRGSDYYNDDEDYYTRPSKHARRT